MPNRTNHSFRCLSSHKLTSSWKLPEYLLRPYLGQPNPSLFLPFFFFLPSLFFIIYLKFWTQVWVGSQLLYHFTISCIFRRKPNKPMFGVSVCPGFVLILTLHPSTLTTTTYRSSPASSLYNLPHKSILFSFLYSLLLLTSILSGPNWHITTKQHNPHNNNSPPTSVIMQLQWSTQNDDTAWVMFHLKQWVASMRKCRVKRSSLWNAGLKGNIL